MDFFFIIAILAGVRLYLVALICISLISNVEIFSYAYWPSVCLLWRNVYLGLLPIFLSGFFVLILLSIVSCL